MQTKFTRSKQIGFLKDLLLDFDVHSISELRALVKGKSTLMHQSKNGVWSFQIVRHRDLELDGENRSYEDKFVFERTIFDCEEISLRNSATVSLKDCVFLGDLFVSYGGEKSVRLSLDTCIFESKLSINLADKPSLDIILTDIWSPRLALMSVRAEKVMFSGGAFGETSLDCVNIGELSAHDTMLGRLQVIDSEIERARVPGRSIEAGRQKGWYKLERLREKQTLFDPVQAARTSFETTLDWDAAALDEHSLSVIETCNFVLEKTDVRHNRGQASQIKYLRALAQSRTPFTKFLVFATGAFLKPARMFLLAASVLAVFAFIYAIFPWQFQIDSTLVTGLSFLDSLYLSCVTFTTVGYGDVAPAGAVRFFAMTEALLGVVIASSLAVTIARRYIE